MCDRHTANNIYVWRKKGEGRRVADLSCSFSTVVHFIMLAAALAFFYQNIAVGPFVSLPRAF